MNSPYVREYLEDRDVTAWFLLDLSPSMGFGPAERPKELVLTDFVVTLARLLTRSGNRIGAILYNEGEENLEMWKEWSSSSTQRMGCTIPTFQKPEQTLF